MPPTSLCMLLQSALNSLRLIRQESPASASHFSRSQLLSSRLGAHQAVTQSLCEALRCSLACWSRTSRSEASFPRVGQTRRGLAKRARGKSEPHRKALQTLQGTSFKQELRRNPEAACKRRKRRFPHRGALINPPFLTHSFPDFPHPPLSGCDRLQGPCSVSHYPAAPCLMSLALFAQRRALSATNRDDGRLDAVFA